MRAPLFRRFLFAAFALASVLVLISFVAFARRASPGPRALCDHLAELQLEDYANHGGEVDEETLSAAMKVREVCNELAANVKLQHPSDYAPLARCIMSAKDLDDVDSCASKFDPSSER
jgi:hypothetical protein